MIIFSQFWEQRSRNLTLLLYIYYLHITWSITIDNDETMLIYLDHCFKSVYISIQPALQFFLRYSTFLIVHSCLCFQQLVLKLVDFILMVFWFYHLTVDLFRLTFLSFWVLNSSLFYRKHYRKFIFKYYSYNSNTINFRLLYKSHY